ncbi:MAG TPA: hypothetical protein VGB61_08740 [Pyrinomonadaceae bacterium]|jgi:hypothetical protein
MPDKKCVTFLAFIFAVLCFGAREARACTCAPKPTTLVAYETADVVVVTRVVSVEKSVKAAPGGRMPGGDNYVDGVKSTRMLVERVFKGNVKADDEMTFAQGGGADCVWTFSEKEIGEQFLFYLNSDERNPAIWYGSGCGRSGGLDGVADDLLYLNKLERVRGKSRLSGTIRLNEEETLGVEGKWVRITGAGKTREVKTDKNGVYEIYDLPAGQYRVEVETPPGWKARAFYEMSLDSLPRIGEDAPKGEFVTLEAKKHTAFDVHFEIDNAVRGKVYDPHGRPMKEVCLSLVPAQGEPPKYFYKAACTKESGAFEIMEIPAGSYLLVVNQDGEISSRHPFKKFYHPNVFERERATVITIGAGDMLDGLDVRVPGVEETVTIEGVFLYADGKPVVKETVEFKAAQTKDNLKGDAYTTTDARGRFSIKILKGLEGELSGRMYTYSGEFENCPKLEALIKKASNTSAELRSSAVKIQGESDLSDVELKYSFPRCKKTSPPPQEQ